MSSTPHMKSDMLIGYRNGKCVAQHIATHADAGVPIKECHLPKAGTTVIIYRTFYETLLSFHVS